MIVGDRIKQAREICGLTQTQLADNIGVNQSAIAQMEAGRISPTEDILHKIVFTTEFPMPFFRQALSVEFPLGSLLLRSRSSLTAREKSVSRQYARIIFETIEKMERTISPLPLRLPRIDEDPVNAAIKTRSLLGLSPDAPIANLINVLEKNGILILALPLNIDKEDAFSVWVGKEARRPIIAITNDAVPGDRLRFSIAHELGHLVIHQTFEGDMKKVEKEANSFAGEFLLPRESMLNEMIPPITLSSLMSLKKRWGVSLAFLARRAAVLQIITQRQYVYLLTQLSANGYRKNEPIYISKEKPRLFSQMAEMLYGKPIDCRKMALQMNLPLKIIRDTVECHIGKIEDRPESGSAQRATILNFDNKN
jgi:Zn-dependent peptidase ImmA (M78 family)/DNA-binding XRE family transcriptional regulator